MKRILFVAALLASHRQHTQQTYPNRPLRPMIVPWPPGQATDLVGRVMAQKCRKCSASRLWSTTAPARAA